MAFALGHEQESGLQHFLRISCTQARRLHGSEQKPVKFSLIQRLVSEFEESDELLGVFQSWIVIVALSKGLIKLSVDILGMGGGLRCTWTSLLKL